MDNRELVFLNKFGVLIGALLDSLVVEVSSNDSKTLRVLLKQLDTVATSAKRAIDHLEVGLRAIGPLRVDVRTDHG